MPGARRGAEAASLPLNPPARLPRPWSAKPSGPKGVASAIVVSATSTTISGNLNGLPVGAGSNLSICPQLTLLPTTRPLQPHAARRDAVEFDAAVPLQPHLHQRDARGQVGVGGIADDEVADLLGAQPDAVEVVGRLDPALLQFAGDDVGRDRLARQPDGGDRDQHKDEEAEHEPLHAAPDQRRPADAVHRPFRHCLVPLDRHIGL